jgi:hypothetical protein
MALSFRMPYVASKYPGPFPHRFERRTLTPTNRQDDGTYHGGVQDFNFAFRYRLPTRRVAMTPFVEGLVPSHEYESNAHAAIGKDLRGLGAGLNVGTFLGPFAYVHTHYSYTVVERVVGIRPNRSRLDSEFGYFLTERLALRFAESLLITHDGWDFPEDPPPGSPLAVLVHHDRLQKAQSLHLGGGLSFVLDDSWDVFASVLGFVWGRNGHAHTAISVGINRRFAFGGSGGQPVAAASRTYREATGDDRVMPPHRPVL